MPEIDDGFLVVFFNISNPFGYRNNYGLEYVDYNLQQLENPFSIRFTKRSIAAIKTILREYELGIRKANK